MTVRPGPRSLYKPNEDAWLESASNEYMILVCDKPSDMAAQRTFREKKTEEFLIKFHNQLVDKHRKLEVPPVIEIKQWRERVRVRFKNIKHKRLKQTTSPNEPLAHLNPLRAFRNINLPSGRDSWREANCALISEQATKEREDSGDHSSKQIGYFKSAEKRAWDALSSEDREKWADDALQPQGSPEKSYTCPQILQNQQVFVQVMTQILRSIIGFDKDQIGLASFNLMYGFRGTNGIVEPGCISVNAASEEDPFHESVDNYQGQFMDPFTAFCEKTIPRLEDRTENLPPAQSFVIKFDDENYPVLPSWGDDEGKSLLELRSLLGDYFSELWKRVRWCDSDNPSAPWDLIERYPETYFPSDTLPPKFRLVRPAHLTHSQVFDLIDRIQAFQTASSSTGTTKRFSFRTKAEIQRRSNQMGGCGSIQVNPERYLGVRGRSQVEATPGDSPMECAPGGIQSEAALGSDLTEAIPGDRPVGTAPTNGATLEAVADATAGEAVSCDPARKAPKGHAADDASDDSTIGSTPSDSPGDGDDGQLEMDIQTGDSERAVPTRARRIADSGERGSSQVEAAPGDSPVECAPGESQLEAALGSSLAEAVPGDRPASKAPEGNAVDDVSNNSTVGSMPGDGDDGQSEMNIQPGDSERAVPTGARRIAKNKTTSRISRKRKAATDPVPGPLNTGNKRQKVSPSPGRMLRTRKQVAYK